jgi:deoxyribodipyrimidine photo-lyase
MNQQSRTAIFWFRRDLRLEDNAGLFFALNQYDTVIPLFIFDRQILDLLDNKEDKRVSMIYLMLQKINTELGKHGSSILIKYGHVTEVFGEITSDYQIDAVFCNRDYEPETIRRDKQVEQLLQQRGIVFHTFRDQVIFESDEILKDDGKPYTVFTPYSKKWKQKLQTKNYQSFPSEELLSKCIRKQFEMPDLTFTGFYLSLKSVPEPVIDSAIIRNYHETRNFPANLQGTSSLSIHLRFGTVSVRKLVATALQENETWLNELIWREFFKSILHHFPEVTKHAFKKQYDMIEWRNNEADFERWRTGTTGFALVDAGMRELSSTGLMHNRVRMLTAGFLTKHLLIDWKWGEAWFASLLLDYDLSANNGNWQWAAGSGCDAAPYFRIFNPDEQIRKFDPEHEYIRRWVPEFGTPAYPEKMVDHVFARQRALVTYQKALREA